MAVKSGSSVDEAALLIEQFSEVRKTVVAERNARLAKMEKTGHATSSSIRASFRSGQQGYHGRTQTAPPKKKGQKKKPL